MLKVDFAAVFARAHEAGLAAGHAALPVPMLVGSAKSLFGNEIDYAKPVYHVPEGVCGFAWVHLVSARDPAANYAKKNGFGRKAYGKGVDIWVRGFGQSYERKMAYAVAYAAVLKAEGIEAYADGRLD